MRVRTLTRLGALVVVSLTAIALMAAPASAGSWLEIKQETSSGGIYSLSYFNGDDTIDVCPGGDESIQVSDFDREGTWGTEAHLYARRQNSSDPFERVAVVRAWDGTTYRCVSLAEGTEVKFSTWKYNGSDKWSRKSEYGNA